MEVSKTKEGSKLIAKVSGRLDTLTAPDLEKELKDELPGLTELVLDFSSLEYISSAGLRVLLTAQKVMARQGSMVITGVSEVVQDIFDVTGFSDILTIE